MSGLDFVVIGAQKAATTTLYQWLRSHPGLLLPSAKESAFFDQVPAPDARQYRTWLDGLFPEPAGRLVGKATPQYMCFEWAGGAIAAHAPDAKLVALLRDPVERARSHWRMRARMRTESRSFADAVRDQLTARGDVTREEDGYVAFGEYGRVLAAYREHFPAEQLLVLEDTAMRDAPEETLRLVCSFLGVPPHTPDGGYEVRYNAAPRRRRLRERILWRVVPYHLALRLLPERLKIGIGGLLDRLSVERPEADLDDALPADLEQLLRDHYRTDAVLLAAITGADPYWLAAWDDTTDRT